MIQLKTILIQKRAASSRKISNKESNIYLYLAIFQFHRSSLEHADQIRRVASLTLDPMALQKTIPAYLLAIEPRGCEEEGSWSGQNIYL